MIGLIMAGGKGLRMNSSQEKLLLNYKKPVILHVLDALKNSNCFSKIIAVTSSNAPKTRNLLIRRSVETIDTLGKGYALDLNLALQQLNEPVFVTSGDLPFLDSDIVRSIVSFYDKTKDWITILTTTKFLESLHMSSDFYVNFNGQQCHYTGISLVNSDKISDLGCVLENFQILDDKRIAFNLNTKKDYDLLSTT